MSRCQLAARPITRCIRQAFSSQAPVPYSIPVRLLHSSSSWRADVEPTITTPPPMPPPASETAEKDPEQAMKDSADVAKQRESMKAQWLDPNTTTLRWAEKKLAKQGTMPIGSRRRRMAVRTSANLPFEQLPYQCFQEARKILAEDREEKLRDIKDAYEKLNRTIAKPAENFRNGEYHKQKMIGSLRRHIEDLKILADINDPLVKRRWENGEGDLHKPIYRLLSRQKWEGMAYKVLVQRVSQFKIVPDVLPKFRPTADVQLSFRNYRVAPGEIVDSLVSEAPPRLRVQTFDGKERLVSVVVMDSDVPVPEEDSFAKRCHYLAANVPLGCLPRRIAFETLDEKEQLAVPWLPAYSQEGAPYHRMSIFLLEQKNGEKLDVEKLKELYSGRDGFSLKSFRDKFELTPFAFNIFRSVWDKGTAAVMERHGIPGSEIVYRNQKVESLKPHRKARGWEAKRQGPKYRFLWKYTKRIAPMSGGT